MKMKKFMIMFMTLLMIVMSTTLVFANENTSFENNTVQITSYGAASANATTIGKKKLQARRAAILNGYRALLEEVHGISIDGKSTVQDLAFASETTNAQVQGVVKGAHIVSERWIAEDENYEVVMSVPIYGISGSIASAVIPKNETKENFPTPVTNPNVSVNGTYTGLVIDCRGLGLKPVMSPVIKDTNGTPIYGHKNLDYNKVVSNGMAGYSHSINSYDRAGNNPLVIKAVSLENFNAYPIVSVEDANRILVENQVTHFLDNTNVVFIRD